MLQGDSFDGAQDRCPIPAFGLALAIQGEQNRCSQLVNLANLWYNIVGLECGRQSACTPE